MYCVIKCIMQVNQVRVKNADLRHLSCTVVMYKCKSASPVLSVLIQRKQFGLLRRRLLFFMTMAALVQ